MTRRIAVGMGLVGLMASTVAMADDMIGVVPELHLAYDYMPYEAARTVTAAHQLASKDYGRAVWALNELEGLMALSGHRAEAVRDGLERGGALKLVESAGSVFKTVDLVARHRKLVKDIERRLEWASARAAKEAYITTPDANGEVATMKWNQAHVTSGEAAWWTVAVSPTQEIGLHVKGCDDAEARSFHPDGQRLGDVVEFDDKHEGVLRADEEREEIRVRVDRAPWCGDAWSVAFVRRTAPPAVTGGLTRETAQPIPEEGAWRLAADEAGVRWFRFTAQAGTSYGIQTLHLHRDVDTSIALYPQGSSEPDIIDDDSGVGLASKIRLATIEGGTYDIAVNIDEGELGGGFEFKVEPYTRFKVTGGAFVSDVPTTLPASAWNGDYIPINFEQPGVPGQITFQAVEGTIYEFETDLKVKVVGPNGFDARPLYRHLPDPAESIHPVQRVLCSETGTSILHVEPADGQSWGASYVLRMTAAETGVPSAHPRRLGATRESPKDVKVSRFEDFTGGVTTGIEPGESVWGKFHALPQNAYHAFVDGLRPDSKLDVAVYCPAESVRPTHSVAEANHIPELDWFQEEPGDDCLLKVTNQDDAPDDARVAVYREPAYNGLRVGDTVLVQAHVDHQGDDNWSPTMWGYVGRQAKVTEFVGRDETGSWMLKLDVDGGRWSWRARSLQLLRRAH